MIFVLILATTQIQEKIRNIEHLQHNPNKVQVYKKNIDIKTKGIVKSFKITKISNDSLLQEF